MRKLLLALVLALLPLEAHAQVGNTTGLVVGTCGSPTVSFIAGNPGPFTINTAGVLCTAASGGGGGTSSTFGAAFPATGTAIGLSDGTNMVPLRGDTTNGAWVNVKTALPAGTNNIGNVGGKTVSVCVTPTVTTANAYGTNFVVGGLLTFANAFTATGSGILQTVTITVNKVETSGFTFTPFNANPSNTTWTDAAAANINSADVPKVRPSVSLNASSVLGTHTVLGAVGLAQATAPGTTSLFGVLTTNATLTNNFTTTSDVQVCVTILQDL